MSDKSGIAWTDATWNPTTGCTKVSPGCKFCYAKHQAWPRLAAMKTGVYTGRKFEDVQVHPERLDQPLRWTKPRMIFVNSMSDLFHEDIPGDFILKVFETMARAGHHIFQVLTKRPERMLRFIRNRLSTGHGRPLPNVWLGVSVENQETADERIPLLLETPAAVRWVSAEPLLGPMDLSSFMWPLCAHWPTGHGSFKAAEAAGEVRYERQGLVSASRKFLDWVVVGGESGPNARPMKAGWAQNLMLECRDSSTPFFMKQGSQTPEWPKYHDIKSFPFNLQVRQYPRGTNDQHSRK